ncbi:hypothetical protein BDR03DRAFT_1014103 [Suillus americanus]|nr:hypothetical protein BDR03DRAFT_1014103 [Suillus americanus]
MTKHDITETPNSLPDANMNRYPYPEKRASMDVSPPTRQATVVNPTHPPKLAKPGRSSTTDEEGYAGDAAWEDPTWKGIVHLKEDMFWACVGGVR